MSAVIRRCCVLHRFLVSLHLIDGGNRSLMLSGRVKVTWPLLLIGTREMDAVSSLAFHVINFGIVVLTVSCGRHVHCSLCKIRGIYSSKCVFSCENYLCIGRRRR